MGLIYGNKYQAIRTLGNTLLWHNESKARMKDMHGGKKGRLAIVVVVSSCSVVVVVVSVVLTVLTVLVVKDTETAGAVVVI